MRIVGGDQRNVEFRLEAEQVGLRSSLLRGPGPELEKEVALAEDVLILQRGGLAFSYCLR